jgi:hypothetical protein
MIDVEADILVLNPDNRLYVSYFLHHLAVQLIISDELGLKLIRIVFVHAEFAGTACVGVGISKL